jgi:phosphoglycolate phosphatase-like HAD superfamily hydrolase
VYAEQRKVLLASSAKATEVEHYAHLLGIDAYLFATISADDVENSKPARDIFAGALKKVAPLRASETLVIGDTPYDVIAAAKCGIKAVALLSGGFTHDELHEAGAIAVYGALRDILEGWGEFSSACLRS